MDPFVSVDDFDYIITGHRYEGTDSIVNVQAVLREDKPWGKKGTVIAHEQFVVEAAPYPTGIVASGKCPKVKQSAQEIIVTTNNGSVIFDALNGALKQILADDEAMLAHPLEPYFWKPENDNQWKAGFRERLGVWTDCAAKRELKDVRIEKGKHKLTVEFQMTLPVGADYTLRYEINNDGEILVHATYVPKTDDIPLIPKFGMRMALNNNNNSITYVGRGPYENYPDRKLSQHIGIYTLSIDEMKTEYIRPQDNGYRCDTRIIRTQTEGNHTLQIEGLQPLCFNVRDYADEELDKGHRHPQDIQRDGLLHMNIDLGVHGVGGINTWGSRTLPEYTLSGNKRYEYGFILNVK